MYPDGHRDGIHREVWLAPNSFLQYPFYLPPCALSLPNYVHRWKRGNLREGKISIKLPKTFLKKGHRLLALSNFNIFLSDEVY